MADVAAVLRGPALLDGGMGTALLGRGLAPGAVPEEWVLDRPGEIARVHAEHAAAAARVLLTCTFGCAAPRLEARIDPDRVEEVCAKAAALARAEAADGGAHVAGAVGPTGLVPPLGPGATPAALEARYARPFGALAAAGVDLLWIESQHELGEALAALRAARRTGLPAAVTFGLAERDGRLVPPSALGAPVDWLLAAEAEGAVAAGVNCVFPGPALDALAAEACARLRVPVVLKPSPGLPGALLSPDAFAAALRTALAGGVRLVGGCCGATGAHLRALASELGTAAAQPPSP
jgi:5-methyltetrahydrofolate--homocysteine methyltransferase